MVTVGIIKDDNSIGHISYAVAIADPTEAIRAALSVCAGEAAVINHKLGDEAVRNLGLKAGDVLEIYDDESDPITSRARRH